MRAAFFVLFLTLLAPPALADMVLVANPRSGVERLKHDEVVNIYLGRYRRLPSGLTAEPLDQPAESEMKARFYRQLVGKSLAEINAYWARLVFSGKTLPPLAVASSDEALAQVAARHGALAYIERAKADKRVLVVYELGD